MVFPKNPIQQFTIEEIHAHIRKIGGRVGWLLHKRGDTVFIIGGEYAKPRGFFDGNTDRTHCQVGAMIEVERDHRLVIHGVDMIAGKDEHEFGKIPFDKGKILLDGICRSGEPIGVVTCLIGSKNFDTAGKVTVQIPWSA